MLFIRLSGRLSHNGGEQASINLLLKSHGNIIFVVHLNHFRESHSKLYCLWITGTRMFLIQFIYHFEHRFKMFLKQKESLLGPSLVSQKDADVSE